ncbi:MAG TPA: DUF1016 N-terminal domain-containing protein [Polyangiaceae bacterium]|nr:DUF1016 N-terminal domain-containing protein [Polyangiaceae bacterium]
MTTSGKNAGSVTAASKRPGKLLTRASRTPGDLSVSALVRDLGTMIDAARKQVAVAANAALTTLYWQIGHRVRTEVLDERRAKYGGQIVSAVGRQLEVRYGRGFGEKSLRHMIRFAQAFPEPEIVSTLRRRLSWSHLKQLIYFEDELKRTFYAEMCRVEGGRRGRWPRRSTVCSSSEPRSPKSRRL